MAVVALQVVDVGGGTGFCTQGIVQTVRPSNVTLIDQSPHQLAKARKKADLQGTTVVQVSSTQVKGLLALVNHSFTSHLLTTSCSELSWQMHTGGVAGK